MANEQFQFNMLVDVPFTDSDIEIVHIISIDPSSLDRGNFFATCYLELEMMMMRINVFQHVHCSANKVVKARNCRLF